MFIYFFSITLRIYTKRIIKLITHKSGKVWIVFGNNQLTYNKKETITTMIKFEYYTYVTKYTYHYII